MSTFEALTGKKGEEASGIVYMCLGSGEGGSPARCMNAPACNEKGKTPREKDRK